MGADFPAMTGNLVRNLRENCLGVLSMVLTRDWSFSPPAGCLKRAWP
jgi:hypothetical protein